MKKKNNIIYPEQFKTLPVANAELAQGLAESIRVAHNAGVDMEKIIESIQLSYANPCADHEFEAVKEQIALYEAHTKALEGRADIEKFVDGKPVN